MGHAKVIHWTIIFLSLYSIKDGVGADDYTPSQRECINAIKMDFRIDLNTDASIGLYAYMAMLYLRFSSNQNKNTFEFEFANAYYRLLSRHITYGPHMLIPSDYCDMADLSGFVQPCDNPEYYAILLAQERSNCKSELLESFHSRANTGGTGVMNATSHSHFLSDIINEVYFKHVLNDFKKPPGLQSSEDYLYHSYNYMIHVADNIKVDRLYNNLFMDTPEQYCQKTVKM